MKKPTTSDYLAVIALTISAISLIFSFNSARQSTRLTNAEKRTQLVFEALETEKSAQEYLHALQSSTSNDAPTQLEIHRMELSLKELKGLNQDLLDNIDGSAESTVATDAVQLEVLYSRLHRIKTHIEAKMANYAPNK